MKLLRDKDLIEELIVKEPRQPLIQGLVLPKEEYSTDSPVQAASVDLHIGNIYIPGTKSTKSGGVESPKSDHSLRTGETAVVTTQETINFPGNIAGLVFPHSTDVAFRGLLVTNPGHVDPGFTGVLRFTVINMSHESFSLVRGRPIVTLLIFQMDKFAEKDWVQRNPQGSSLPKEATIDRLSKDFLDLDKRARRIARAQGVRWSVGITVAGGILVAILQLLSSGQLFNRAAMRRLEQRQDKVESDLKNSVNVDQKLQDFDKRLSILEHEHK